MSPSEQDRALELYAEIHAVLIEATRTQEVDQLLRLSIRYNVLREKLDPLIRPVRLS